MNYKLITITGLKPEWQGTMAGFLAMYIHPEPPFFARLYPSGEAVGEAIKGGGGRYVAIEKMEWNEQ